MSPIEHNDVGPMETSRNFGAHGMIGIPGLGDDRRPHRLITDFAPTA
jgi:hypothetical protein